MNRIDDLGPAQPAGPDQVAPANTLHRLPDPQDRYRASVTKAAIEFEGFFIAHMMHQMRSGTRELAGEDSVFKDPVNSDMQDMADTMVANQMAGQRAFGVADAILRQLLPPAPAQPVAPLTPPTSEPI